jgi:hypothetical protein
MGTKWTFGRLFGGVGVEWIHLAQDRDRWRAVVNVRHGVSHMRILPTHTSLTGMQLTTTHFYFGGIISSEIKST